MKKEQNAAAVTLDRRSLFGFIVCVAMDAVVAKIPIAAERSSETAFADQEYLIVNGWVLRCDDFASTIRASRHVIRF